MANSAVGSVWRLDTAPFTYKFPVKVMNLNISAAAADHIVITQINGQPLVDFTATADELQYRVGNLGWSQGIVIGSGGLGTAGIVEIAVGAGK